MSHSFIGSFEYFDEALGFLKDHQWIYNYPNTDILTKNIFDKIPYEWISYFKDLSYKDLKNLSLCKWKDNCPKSLANFLEKIRYLSVTRSKRSFEHECIPNKKFGLSRKKHHEILALAPLIAEVCDEVSTNQIVDIGAGLGYLSHLLAEDFECSVLAIEGCPQKTQLALTAQTKYLDSVRKNVTFCNHFITENSENYLDEILKSKFPNERNICMCGLHACADLSVTILGLFLRMSRLKALVIMPCCYHRLALKETQDEREYFESFPVSAGLKYEFDKKDASTFLRRPFLRLACQQTSTSFVEMNDDQHGEHARNFLMRAVLQKAAEEAGSYCFLRNTLYLSTGCSIYLETGYLSHLLAEDFECSVLAIEGCPQKTQLALTAQTKYLDSVRKNVTFCNHFITENSENYLDEILKSKFPNERNICMCGLHACADLSVTILGLFLRMSRLKALVIMPCCYHRLALKETQDEREYFESFPVSAGLKYEFDKKDASTFLRRPFLRLACQQTSTSFVEMNDDQHGEHARNFLMRAVLQKAAEEAGCKVSRLKRKSGKSLNQSDISFYVKNFCKNYKLEPKNPGEETKKMEDMDVEKRISEIWERNKDKLILVEALSALQNAIQIVCENILLQDRVQFLLENGVNCYIEKITDDNISPRCHALVAIKQ